MGSFNSGQTIRYGYSDVELILGRDGLQRTPFLMEFSLRVLGRIHLHELEDETTIQEDGRMDGQPEGPFVFPGGAWFLQNISDQINSLENRIKG